MNDTITIRCSCGGTFEEPVEGIWSRPIPEFNSGEHHGCPLPEDGREQIEAAIAEWERWQRVEEWREECG